MEKVRSIFRHLQKGVEISETFSACRGCLIDSKGHCNLHNHISDEVVSADLQAAFKLPMTFKAIAGKTIKKYMKYI